MIDLPAVNAPRGTIHVPNYSPEFLALSPEEQIARMRRSDEIWRERNRKEARRPSIRLRRWWNDHWWPARIRELEQQLEDWTA